MSSPPKKLERLARKVVKRLAKIVSTCPLSVKGADNRVLEAEEAATQKCKDKSRTSK
jgi:hypothetical protein